MKIKMFPSEPAAPPLVFGSVKTNQFFVTASGHLCQKVDGSSYTIVADYNKRPYSDYRDGVDDSFPIAKILPEVTEIEF